MLSETWINQFEVKSKEEQELEFQALKESQKNTWYKININDCNWNSKCIDELHHFMEEVKEKIYYIMDNYGLK